VRGIRTLAGNAQLLIYLSRTFVHFSREPP